MVCSRQNAGLFIHEHQYCVRYDTLEHDSPGERWTRLPIAVSLSRLSLGTLHALVTSPLGLEFNVPFNFSRILNIILLLLESHTLLTLMLL